MLIVLLAGVSAAAKNPAEPINLENIQKVVALLALVFATKKSAIPLKLNV